MAKPFKVMTIRVHPNEMLLVAEMARQSRLSLNKFVRSQLGLSLDSDPTLSVAQKNFPFSDLDPKERQEVIHHVIKQSKFGDEVLIDPDTQAAVETQSDTQAL